MACYSEICFWEFAESPCESSAVENRFHISLSTSVTYYRYYLYKIGGEREREKTGFSVTKSLHVCGF